MLLQWHHLEIMSSIKEGIQPTYRFHDNGVNAPINYTGNVSTVLSQLESEQHEAGVKYWIYAGVGAVLLGGAIKDLMLAIKNQSPKKAADSIVSILASNTEYDRYHDAGIKITDFKEEVIEHARSVRLAHK